MKKYLFLLLTLASLNTNAQMAAGDIASNVISQMTPANIATATEWIYDHFDEMKDAAANPGSLFNESENLDEAECAPDFSGDVSNSMFATCGENTTCKECYKGAMKKMNFFRRQLGRLNCIYKNTTAFSAWAVSFGDSYSGFHSMSAAAWQVQKTKILQSLKTLKKTYDTKYIEFIKGLGNALMEFDACENEYGSGNWYQKSGFIYFDMMKERYKRND